MTTKEVMFDSVEDVKRFVQQSEKQPEDIDVCCGSCMVDGKSILGILSLGIQDVYKRQGLNTLGDFRHNSKYIARSGEEGGKRRCTGKDGENLIIRVPEGTVIYDDESGKVIADMSGENMRETILKGGRGGKGNMNYATATMQLSLIHI